MAIDIFQKTSFTEYLGIEESIADCHPEVCNGEVFSLEADKDDRRGRISEIELFTFTVKALKYGLTELGVFRGWLCLDCYHEFIATNPIHRQACIPQNNSNPMQHGIASYVSILVVERLEVVQVDEQE